jgi:hypothetical protein
MKEKIKVGFCIAYDWPLLEHSVPLIYENSDEIYLSIDDERKSWNGQKYNWDQFSFDRLIEEIDIENKIRVVEGEFHNNGYTSMENEVRQRNYLANYMGNGGWHIQLDVDEYFINFGDFVNFLNAFNLPGNEEINICCCLITILKRSGNDYFIVEPDTKRLTEFVPVATKKPCYEYGRRNGYFNHFSPFTIVHQSWARDEEEVLFKIKNWGHNKDFDSEAFISTWRSIGIQNYDGIRNFHPIDPEKWPRLKHINAVTTMDIVNEYIQNPIKIPRFLLAKKNSRFLNRVKTIFK